MPVLERGCRSKGKDEIFQISFNPSTSMLTVVLTYCLASHIPRCMTGERGCSNPSGGLLRRCMAGAAHQQKRVLPYLSEENSLRLRTCTYDCQTQSAFAGYLTDHKGLTTVLFIPSAQSAVATLEALRDPKLFGELT
jgi:hypothetical protein